jgi:hypothetical protein
MPVHPEQDDCFSACWLAGQIEAISRRKPNDPEQSKRFIDSAKQAERTRQTGADRAFKKM